jgi:hypothetical protein
MEYRDVPNLQDRLSHNVWVSTAHPFVKDVSSQITSRLMPLFLANALGVLP